MKCPLNCILSRWTEFTPCSRKCGSGIKTRFRTVVQKATHGGQACNTENEQITETVPCIENHCYNYVWEADPWSHCKVMNQTKGRITKCGTGVVFELCVARDACAYLRQGGRASYEGTSMYTYAPPQD